jgi:hypothetical protein
LSSAGLFDIENAVADLPVLAGPGAGPTFDGCERTTDLVVGERRLRALLPAIRELRLRCGQRDDFTTDMQYFIAANTQKNRRVAAVLIRRNLELEACVLFFEHCKFGMGLGLMRGGDAVGEGLVAGPEAFRVHYVRLATQALLQHWRIHGVSLAVRACLSHCISVMGPESEYRMFSGRTIERKLPLESTYRGMLAGMGPRTRRSLAGKRQQLETRANVVFFPSLEPSQALEAMLRLQSRSLPTRITRFYHARYNLLCESPDFFSMGMQLPDGTWLSMLSGWRRNGVTYVDMQMNDINFKKESLSAVMRAFMLEHEIGRKQQLVNFIGGTSLLLRRYCRPIEPSTDIFLWRPCLRARVFKILIPRMKPESVYERVKTGIDDQSSDHS